MGMDIIMYAEKKENEKWQLCMPQSNLNEYKHYSAFDVGGRIPALFQILSRLYGEDYGEEFKSISIEKGLPKDICNETKWYMEDLIHCSYLTLKEILGFDWDLEPEQYDSYRKIVSKEFFDVVRYLQTLVSERITENNIRIVFGYSC